MEDIDRNPQGNLSLLGSDPASTSYPVAMLSFIECESYIKS